MNKRRYKKSKNRTQSMLFPPSMDEYVGDNNTIRAIAVYIYGLDLKVFGVKASKKVIT